MIRKRSKDNVEILQVLGKKLFCVQNHRKLSKNNESRIRNENFANYRENLRRDTERSGL